MPARIPIAEAKRVADAQGCQQVIILAWDGERTHVVTYGDTKKACREAAEGANRLKAILGWPSA